MTRNPARTTSEMIRTMSGAERVAALLLAMGKSSAERLLPYFEAPELRQISTAASELRAISSTELEALIEEFVGEFGAGLNLLLSAREMTDMLEGAIPAEANSETEIGRRSCRGRRW